MAASLLRPVIWTNWSVWCWGVGELGGSDADKEHQSEKGGGDEERGETEIRLREESERKYRSGVGLHGKQKV